MPLNNFGYVCSKTSGKTIDFEGLTYHLYRSAQPYTRDAQTLYKLGIKSIVKLNLPVMGSEEFPYYDNRITTYNCPLPSLFRFRSLHDIIKICDKIDRYLTQGNVLVHCTHGRDRTGLVCAAYRILYHGATISQVNEERAEYGVNSIIGLFDYPDKLILKDIANERD